MSKYHKQLDTYTNTL